MKIDSPAFDRLHRAFKTMTREVASSSLGPRISE
jgi:hypothetical protein